MSEQPSPAPSDKPRGERRRLLVRGTVAGLAVALAVAVLLWRSGVWQPNTVPPPDDETPTFPIPAVASSPFRNTGPDARYVGSAACTGCHQGETHSFRRTGMGRSMAAVDPAREPADAAFDHPASKRRYLVTRKDGQLWHRELLLTGGPEEVVLSEFPLKYVVGSGRHGRTYLVEAEGFLVESPVTWYPARQAWGMSPGYDRADHLGFERAVGEGCLVCHAGHAEPVGKSQHRMLVKEPAISCERCHGPGSLHVEHQRANRRPGDGIDYTIVNPAHLPRDLAEAVCQQCHLHSAAAVPGRGRKLTDFRPGLPLRDFRQDYRLEVADTPMTVVGHVEQMHLSRCYQKSKTLTCTTCHDPHGFPPPEKHVTYYRAICLDCHKPNECKVPPARLHADSPDNNCVKCHMPGAPTDVPHVSFTHHRIGRHEPAPATPAHPGVGTLRPFQDYPHLGAADKKRSLGLAYLDLARDEKKPGLAAAYRDKGFDLLGTVFALGLRDSVLEAKLARLHFERNQDQALALAESALADPGLAGLDRCTALFVLGAERLKRNQFQQARTVFRELVTLRRHPHDWQVLADCEMALGNKKAAVAALETAARINPRQVQIHQFLANHFRQLGDPKRAAWHQQRAVP